MSFLPESLPRVHKHALIFTATATMLLLPGCGKSDQSASESNSAGTTTSSEESATSSEQSTAKSSPAAPMERSQGRVNTVAGSVVTLGAKKGPTTVAVTPSTKVIQSSAAQLSDVAPGSCVNVRKAAAPAAGATSVTVSPSANGKCPEANEEKALRGAVAGVNGQTLSVTVSGSPVTIDVDPKTQFSKQAPASALAITPGTCLLATGSPDPQGVLQASSATVSPPPPNGPCPGA